MDPVEYTRRLRRTATVSWLAALCVMFALVWIGAVPSGAYLPFAALLLGAIPIAAFALRNRPSCQACGGRMRISAGYPRIVYRCRECGATLHTGIHADF